jgi:hypothetical protein
MGIAQPEFITAPLSLVWLREAGGVVAAMTRVEQGLLVPHALVGRFGLQDKPEYIGSMILKALDDFHVKRLTSEEMVASRKALPGQIGFRGWRAIEGGALLLRVTDEPTGQVRVTPVREEQPRLWTKKGTPIDCPRDPSLVGLSVIKAPHSV